MKDQVRKLRLDLLLLARGMAESREKAQAMIMAGLVTVDGRLADKPGQRYPETAVISLRGPLIPYVSRGGLKLEAAIKAFGLPVEGKVALDIGASTGGFTDCLLQHGAKQVFAVDVGHGQLHHKIRHDPRVCVIERFNARYLTREQVPVPPDIITIDVSFISVKKIIPGLRSLMKPATHLVILVKPQFEAGRSKVRRGVVRDPNTHVAVLQDMFSWLKSQEFEVLGAIFSPITGPEGNIEFLLHAVPVAHDEIQLAKPLDPAEVIPSLVEGAHLHFGRVPPSAGSIRGETDPFRE